MTVSELADRYRILSEKSAFPGRWETSLFPFQRAIMDAFAIDWIEEIWIKKPSKVGGTDIMLNMLLYAALQDPGPALLVEPTEELAEEISTKRIDDMINDCDELNHLCVSKTKSEKIFRNMILYFAWAGSPTSLAYKEIRYAFFDEVAKYMEFSGKESSPISLGRERTTTFKHSRKHVFNSTPTVEGNYISAGEEKADCRFRYFVKCPHCGHPQVMYFSKETLKFGEDHRPSAVEQAAWYECEKCHGKIYSSEKDQLVLEGEWRDIKSGLPFHEAIEKLHPRVVGFQFSRFISPLHTFGDIAAEFLRSKDDRSRLMNFFNSWLGEDWVERVYHKEASSVLLHKTEIEPLVCPPHTIALTAGVDPGQGGFWFTVLAWLNGNRVHLLHYGFLFGGWELVRQLLMDNVYQDAAGKPFKVFRAGIDTGGSQYEDDPQTMTTACYNFIRSLGVGHIFGTKGQSWKKPGKMTLSIIDRMPGQKNFIIRGGLALWLINTDAFKDDLHYRLQVAPGEPGGITLHAEVREDFAEHILSEEKRRDRHGVPYWHALHKRNHLLDACIIALAMGDAEAWGGVRVLGEEKPQQQVEQQVVVPEVHPFMLSRKEQARWQAMSAKNGLGEFGRKWWGKK